MKNITRTIYDLLPVMALLATPLAVAIPFGWSVYTDLLNLTQIVWVALVSAIAATIALEAIGITSGKTALDYYDLRDKRWILAAGIMALYVLVIGIEVINAAFWKISGLSIIAILMLSPSVYLLVALKTQLAEAMESSRELSTEQKALDRKLREQEVELEAQLKLLKAQTESTIALREQEAKLEAKREAAKYKRQIITLPATPAAAPNGSGPKRLEDGQWACPHWPDTCDYPPQLSKMAVAGHMRRHNGA